MNDTPTPRTDEQINGKPCTRFAIVAGDSLRDAYVSSEFASTLERELTAAREEIEMMGIRYAAREMHTQTIVDESNSVTEQLKNAQAELLKLCLREQLLHDDYKSEKTRADDALLALTAAREESANAKAECLKACLREQLTYEDMRAEKNRADEALLALNQSDLDLKLVTEQRDRLAEAIQKYITEDYSASILTNALKSLNQNAELMAEQAIPDELYDGYAVYQSLTEREKRFTTPENVSAALDAVVRLIKQNV